MSTPDDRTAPIDAASAALLSESGLRLALVDTSDATTFDPWLDAESRGFHAEAFDPKDTAQRDAVRAGIAYRRTTGVWDPSALVAAEPVGTVNSWSGELAVPGGSTPAWAISGVTVAPTHRRRGIARALLEAELRTAAALGTPLAMLTVSEATIYGRFGFAPAAMASTWTIETRRAGWAGPTPEGRVDFVPVDEFRRLVEPMYERVRARRVGEVSVWPLLWDRLSGLIPGTGDEGRKVRAIAYRDAAGAVRGVAAYKVVGSEADFANHRLELIHLLDETPDAAAALWRFLLEMDLVTELTAELRPVDDPLRWQLRDRRAARVVEHDHLWLRVLDVPAAFAARRYRAAGRIAFRVADPLGFAEGRWLLEVDASGVGAVSRVDDLDPAVPELRLGVAELGALYLGGVAATTLADAGRLSEQTPGAAAAADSILRADRAPWLSIWF